jgi:anti-anti-sigma regulatory factor
MLSGQPMLVLVDDDEATERRAEVRGAIDVFSSALLPVRALAGLPESARSLVIDLREVSFVDSAGVSALVKVRQEARSRALEVHAVLGNAQNRINSTVVELLRRVLPCDD